MTLGCSNLSKQKSPIAEIIGKQIISIFNNEVVQHLQQLWILTCFHFTHYFLHLANTFTLKKRNSINQYFRIILNEKLSIFEILFSPLLVFFSTSACGSTSLYFQPPHQSSSSFYQRGANVNAAILVIDLVFIPPISTSFCLHSMEKSRLFSHIM